MTNQPFPVLVGHLPVGGHVLSVNANLGGMAGITLLGADAGLTLTISTDGGATYAAPVYPHTLSSGQKLKLLRAVNGAELLSIYAQLPAATTGAAFTVTTDNDSYQVLDGASTLTDSDGYQTIQSATATTDSDGYQTVEGSSA